MSYSRFGWDGSDVYVFLAVDSGLECCGCQLQEREWVDDPTRPIFGGYLRSVGQIIRTTGLTTDEMIAHLREHERAGQHVPAEVFVELAEDRDENDAYTASCATRKGAAS